MNTPTLVRLEAPISTITKRLTERDFIKENKPHPKFIWMPGTHKQILHQYNAIFRGFSNYYSFVWNKGKLISKLHYFLSLSCAKLLAAKFSLGTMKRVFNKFGKDLTYKETTETKTENTSFARAYYRINL